MDLYKSKYSDGKTDGRNSRRENNPYRSFRNSGDTRGSRNDSRDESTTVTCSDCGTECTVPFVPRTNKPVFCSDCFRKNKPEDSGNDRYSRDDRGSRNDRGSRYSRDDRGSRSSPRRESSRDNSRSSKPRNDKFLRKRESFFSGGSDKFFETIKEKLYEILGGKICSNCGFKDERALGISPISDDVTSDNSGRGGDAASWGKYISAPDLAREELKVFCLNCNQIREPTPKSTEDRSRPKSKKSKYFPR
jgi:CxxC-x17-CxxC domain-containing protein